MASGVYTFNPNIGELIVGAFARIKVRRTEITASHMADARLEANLLQVQWGNKGPNLWSVDNQTIMLSTGQGAYDVPANTTDILDAYLTIDPSAGPEDFLPSDFLPTDFQTGLILPIFDFSNDMQTSLAVLDPAKAQGFDRTMLGIGRSEFAQIPNKAARGTPSTFWFMKAQAPKVYFWPVPNGPYLFNFWRSRQIQDAAPSNGGLADVPYLWIDAFAAGLAHRLARIYAQEMEAARKVDAAEAWATAAAQDEENVPMYLSLSPNAYWN